MKHLKKKLIVISSVDSDGKKKTGIALQLRMWGLIQIEEHQPIVYN
jgi:hypothetical protein